MHIFTCAHVLFYKLFYKKMSLFLHRNVIKFAWMAVQIFKKKIPLLVHSSGKQNRNFHNTMSSSSTASPSLFMQKNNVQHCLFFALSLLFLYYFTIIVLKHMKQKEVIHDCDRTYFMWYFIHTFMYIHSLLYFCGRQLVDILKSYIFCR